ncbi:potassium-transporting ATPase subunit C [Mycobacterium sp. SMC-4]|uniref:potassium-transporting ATPase subunit C n=1 Tax=Mycobacterium sp. SMC-4 TaxID=2857059 RepID=UPI00220E0683|nr:potassium-transporting ATPase subunit C [Mycobacterium sp. SMC-4]
MPAPGEPSDCTAASIESHAATSVSQGSTSGLDPEISVANAGMQAPRMATSRALLVTTVENGDRGTRMLGPPKGDSGNWSDNTATSAPLSTCGRDRDGHVWLSDLIRLPHPRDAARHGVGDGGCS